MAKEVTEEEVRGREHNGGNLPETQNIVGNFDDIDFPPAGSNPLGDIPVYISESDDEPPVQQSAAPPVLAHDSNVRRNPPHRTHGRNRHYEDSDAAETSNEELWPYNNQLGITTARK